MNRNLRDVLALELDAEPAPPLGEIVPEAMRHGRRLRRRRNLFTACGAATAILTVLAVAAVLHDPVATGPAVQVAADRPGRCTAATAAPGDEGAARGRPAEFSIFLREGVTKAQRDSLADALKANPTVAGSEYESPQQVHTRLRETWRDSPGLVDAVPPAQLPESFRIKLKDRATYEAFAAHLREHRDLQRLLDRLSGWVAVYPRNESTEAQRADLAAALQANPLVAESRYDGSPQAYALLEKLREDAPETTRVVKSGLLAGVFWVELKDPLTYRAFTARIEKRRDVDHVGLFGDGWPCATAGAVEGE